MLDADVVTAVVVVVGICDVVVAIGGSVADDCVVATGLCVESVAFVDFGILRSENTPRPFNISADADGHCFRAVVPSSCNFRLSFRRNSSNFLLMRRPHVNTAYTNKCNKNKRKKRKKDNKEF